MSIFQGVHVALVTPFKDNHEVDYKELQNHCDWLIENGIDGLIPGGSLGEYATLTVEERQKVVETVLAISKDRVPVMVGTGAPSTKQAVFWAEHAKENGATSLMALPPINYNPLKNEILAHYEALSGVGLPIVAYNNPHDYPTDLTPELLQEISQFDNVLGVKEFSGDIRRVQDILRLTNLEVMIGVDDLAFEGALMGATGWISGVPNALPKEGKQLFNYGKEKEIEKGTELYQKLLPLFHYDANPQLVQSIKYMMELAGRPCGPTRPPRLSLNETYYQDIKKDFETAKSFILN
ncbi:dihydrodipicolinate synthase family protein [uncultured Marinococcus sp.]|uniref:dihydrodipicolinate synthase family protein n=1 Tax=uncultured Marinococcus sp. TaxID=487012 RepID=UPI002606DB1C|nr:dihydrodipicolinate synthase family protein [uncultured Marinococcus sp.]